MRYFLFPISLFLFASNLNGHENPVEKVNNLVHFHNVKWEACLSGDYCRFNVEGLPTFFGGELIVQITKADVPSYASGLCTAEKRFGGALISLLADRFKNADTIDLMMCEFSITVHCDVRVDGDSIDEWLRRVFSLTDGRTSWCSSW